MPEQLQSPEPGGRFGFERIVVRRLSFQEVERVPPPEGQTTPPAKLSVGFEIRVAVGLAAEQKRVEVTLQVAVKPDPMWRPYVIDLQVGGAFLAVDQTDAEAMKQFAQRAAPVILWPYVREAVYRVTMDAAFGPLLLDPVFLTPLLESGDWQQGATSPVPVSAGLDKTPG